MDSNQASKGRQNYAAGTWKKTGIKPFESSSLKFSLPKNETSDCSLFLKVPTPWEIKEAGIFPILSRRPAPKPETNAQNESGGRFDDD